MSVISGKNILLGITAGIAAYKTAFLARLLVKAGAKVKVVMTEEAKAFVTPLTLSTLTKNEVVSSFTKGENQQWNNHVALGLWADLMLIAPITANTMSKMALGHSDNVLLATYLSAKCPVYFAPAMDLDMYKHPSTQENIEKLTAYGNKCIPVGTGELASGLSGEGRMAEPEEIVNFIEQDILQQLPLYKKKVLITAGPTYEAIDPVRFIGNHSSGKMGYALAAEAARNGAEVILISGPTSLATPKGNITRIDVTNAQEMYNAAHQNFDEADVVIAAAAVSDYRPKHVAEQKIKKNTNALSIELEKTNDILLSLGEKKKGQLLIGFALETENEIEHARQKLHKKNLDFIVLNSLNDKGAGFKQDTNKIRIIGPQQIQSFDLKTKAEVAHDIINEIVQKIN